VLEDACNVSFTVVANLGEEMASNTCNTCGAIAVSSWDEMGSACKRDRNICFLGFYLELYALRLGPVFGAYIAGEEGCGRTQSVRAVFDRLRTLA
jgi:Cdc6-like AAA superfamily ATPase